AGGGVIVLEHVEDGLPQQGQVLLGETGGLAGQIGGDIALAPVQSIGDDVLAAHLRPLFLRVRLGSDGHPCNGDLLGDNGLHAAGKAQLHRAADLPAVQGGLHKRGHHRAEGADVVEVGAHPVPDFSVQFRIGFFLLLSGFFIDIQRLVGLGIAPVERDPVLHIDAVAGSV
ncbi:nucleoside deaminase, partial [Dysosmobacter welbionis]